jgi:hypothetical protein
MVASAPICPSQRGMPSSHASASAPGRDEDDVLARDRKEVVETEARKSSRSPRGSDCSSPSTDAFDQPASLTVEARRDRVGEPRAQAVRDPAEAAARPMRRHRSACRTTWMPRCRSQLVSSKPCVAGRGRRTVATVSITAP